MLIYSTSAFPEPSESFQLHWQGGDRPIRGAHGETVEAELNSRVLGFPCACPKEPRHSLHS